MADGGIYEFEPMSDTSSAPSGPSATLENTYWKVRDLGGQPARVGDNLPEPHFLLHPANGRASGSTGCNRFSASYQVTGDSLRFGGFISTLRTCTDPALNRQERAFLEALNGTRAWRLTGETLVLRGDTGPVARFMAQYLN